MFETIRTKRLKLRAFEETDAPALAAYRNHPDVARLQTWDGCTLEQAQILIAKVRFLEQPTPDQWFQIAVTHKDQLIGDLAFRLGDQQAEIGYSFDPTFQGQGLAREAVAALLEFAFETLQLHRLHATTDPHNTRSIRLLEQLGFRLEGHLHKSFWFKGTWADDLLFGLLADEYKNPSS